MEAIRTAVQRLQSLPAKNWKGNKEAEDAVIQVSSIIRLFELPAASTATFDRLRQILRTKLLPLYHAPLGLALELTTAILLFLQDNPKVPTHTSGNTQTSCEILLVALVSGILDFVEENSSVKVRETVASSLYPILCPTYILTPYKSVSVLHLKVAPLVYQTFTATAESCPRNAVKLRDQFLNCRNLGYTISITREFLALEALLDLFGILIPPAKASHAARTRYFTSVFSSEFYGKTSKQIVEHLEAIATPEWSVTSREILKMLASSSIVYPQPLEGRAFAFNTRPIEGCSLFYIDKSQLIANIDKDGELDTLHVSLPTILDLNTTQATTSDEVNIAISLSQPPVLGDTEMAIESQKNIKFSFIMKAAYVAHFESVLQQRNVVPRQLGTRKLSKGQPINLDSNVRHDVEDMKLTQQERLNEVSKNILTSPQAASSRNSTSKQASLSPVIRRGDRAKNIVHSVDSTPKKPQTRATTAKAVLPSTVFVDSDGKLSLENPKSKLHGHPKPEPKLKEPQVPPPSPSPAPKKRAGAKTLDKQPELESHYFGQEEDEEKTTTDKSKPLIVDSDSTEKEEDTFIGDSPMVISPVAPQKFYPTRSGRGRVPVKEKNNDNGDTEGAQEKAFTSRIAQAPKKRNRRVVISEDESEIEGDNMEVDEPPKKRARHENVLPPSVRPYKMRKYGRKGRTSSPVPVPVESRSADIDFDEVPTEKGPNLANKKTEKNKEVVANKRGKENIPLKEHLQVVRKEATKTNQEKEKRVLRTKPKQKDEPRKDVKPKPKIISRALSARSSNHAVKLQDARERITRRSSRKAEEIDKSDPIIEISSPERLPEVAPWDDISSPSDPVVGAKISGNSSKGNDALDNAYNAGNEPQAHVASQANTVTSDNEFDVMDEIEDLPPPIVIRDFAKPVVKKQVAPVPAPAKKPKPQPEPVHPVYVKQEPADVIDMTMHNFTSSDSVQEEEEEEPILPVTDYSKPLDLGVEMASTNAGQRYMTVTPRRVPVATKIPQDIKKPALEAPRKTVIPKLSMLKTPEAPVNKLVIPPRAIQRQIVESQPFDRTPAARAQSPIEQQMPNVSKEQIPFRRESLLKGREFGYSRTEHNRTRRHEMKEDPMTRIAQVLAEINDAVLHKIERRFDAVTDSLTTGQRVILEGTAQTLEEMRQESVFYYNQMVDLEEQYTARSSAIFNAIHNLNKSSDQLSQCFNKIKIDHSRQSLSKKLPTSLFPKIPDIISNPLMHF